MFDLTGVHFPATAATGAETTDSATGAAAATGSATD